MKKLTASAILMLITFASVQVNAKTTASKEIKTEKADHNGPGKNDDGIGVLTKDNFYTDFGNVADVKWTKGAPFDEAVFLKDGLKTTAYYDYSSKLVGTTNIKKFADLPARAQKEIHKRYKDYVTGAVVMFEDNQSNPTNMRMYGMQFEGNDHYFVTITKSDKEYVLMVDMDGNVSYFKKIS